MSAVLVAGGASGLGRFLTEKMNALSLTRKNSIQLLSKKKEYDLIIHCAHSQNNDVHDTSNQELTRSLLKISHRYFIYISSCDVYGETGDRSMASEDQAIDLLSAATPYAHQKIECEQLVRELATSYAVLRPTTLVGPYMRHNNFMKLVKDVKPELTLTADSTLSFVTYSEIIKMISYLIKSSLNETYNMGRTQPVTMEEISRLVSKSPSYGNFKYSTPTLNVTKASTYIPELLETSAFFVNNVWRYL
jgi:nucleoside-diphosphate-sugar epimerase